MTAAALLAKLDGVRQIHPGRWRARCPAHDSKNRDVFSISEGNDGTVLTECFVGCTALEIVEAVGLARHDLFRPIDWQKTGHHRTLANRPRTDWAALIAASERDMVLVKIILAMLSRGEPINPEVAAA